MKKPLIVIAGPTAVGKTKTSVALAKALGGEIISADSMQVYRGMTIGTAKVLEEEMEGVPHHLIDVLDPDEACSIATWQTMVKKAMEEIYSRGHIPILVGGTGFYIQSVIYDIDFDEAKPDMTYRSTLESVAQQADGETILHERLKSIDPDSANVIHPNNVKRVIRALEYHHQTGEPISLHNEREKQKTTPYNLAYFVLNIDRDLLYERINHRVDLMIQEGLVNEVQSLLNKGYEPSLVSMQGLGYKEIVAYLNGDCDLEEAVTILKRDTRHFAKRQLTWFRRESVVKWVDVTTNLSNIEAIVNILVKHIEEMKIL